MATALLIGGPLHGETREVDPPRYAVDLVVAVEPERRALTGYGGVGYTPQRRHTHHYRRWVQGLPPEAVVYVADGYEPQPEDEQLVRDRFG